VSDVVEGERALTGAGMRGTQRQPPQILWGLTPAGTINPEHETNHLRGRCLRWEGPLFIHAPHKLSVSNRTRFRKIGFLHHEISSVILPRKFYFHILLMTGRSTLAGRLPCRLMR
jgi:hypothetical protein